MIIIFIKSIWNQNLSVTICLINLKKLKLIEKDNSLFN